MSRFSLVELNEITNIVVVIESLSMWCIGLVLKAKNIFQYVDTKLKSILQIFVFIF